jgi:cytidyltransferase-like protein
MNISKSTSKKSVRKVFVSGCFDMLHSGHVAFLNEASSYGDELYVAIGSDKTVDELKGRKTINSEEERRYMIENLKSVTRCMISRGSGYIDFLKELAEIKPDVFVVNEDGNSPEKARICREAGIEYIVLRRIPYARLAARSTTELRNIVNLPYRIDLAGTWIDQPYVSKYHPGPAIVASLEPTIEFNERGGMATSTRKKARELWPMGLPLGKPEALAKMLFRWDNPPGNTEVSGSQDSLGMMLPGVNKIYYDKNEYWPGSIESIHDENILSWLENKMYFIFLWPRPNNFDVLKETYINTSNVKKLAEAADRCWRAILNKDFGAFAAAALYSFHAQTRMFPAMLNKQITEVIDSYKNVASGWKLSGAGGGGYLVLFAEEHVPGTIQVKIRRREVTL